MKKQNIYYVLLQTDEKPVALLSEPTLKELQSFCGGYIEKISAIGGYLLANDEGQLKNLPLNYTASALHKSVILGNAVFITENYDWYLTILDSGNTPTFHQRLRKLFKSHTC
jgi:hypothetical protein